MTTINGTDGDDDIRGTSASETINGLDGNDFLTSNTQLTGADGDDILNGGNGNDTLTGGGGMDQLIGGAGNDILNANASGIYTFVSNINHPQPSDTVDGGAGVDTLVLDYAGQHFLEDNGPDDDVYVDISTGNGVVEPDQEHFSTNKIEAEKFTSIEILNFSGPEGDDIVIGGSRNDIIDGNGGNDILRGGGGDDQISDTSGFVDADGGTGRDTFTLDRSSDTQDDIIDGPAGTLTVGGVSQGTFVNFEVLGAIGGSGNNTLIGFTDSPNYLVGGNGNDTITGGARADIIYGGGGTNTLKGGAGADQINGGSGKDGISGGSGNDSIVGNGGADSIHGDGGDDTVNVNLLLPVNGAIFDGGSGTDTLLIAMPTPTPTTFSLTHTTTVNFETLMGAGGYENVPYIIEMTSAQFSQFTTINFLLGVDQTVTIELTDKAAIKMPNLSEFSDIQLADGGQTVDLSTATVLYAQVLGGSGDDTVLGTPTGYLNGAMLGAGNDHYLGAGNVATVDGGDGNDTLSAGAGSGAVNFTGDAGTDTLTGGTGNDVLNGGADKDTLTGGGGADKFVYGAASDSTGTGFDIVNGFDASAGKFDFTFAVTAIDTAVTHGGLSTGTFDTNLTNVITAAKLGADHAVLYTPSAGGFAGHTFLIVDGNGTAGYQAGQDFVIELSGATNLGSLGIGNFI